MTDKIKFYLEDRLKRLEDIKNKREWTTAELGDATCCKQTLAFINSLQEEPVSEDLEIAIENSMPKPYFHIEDGDDYYGEDAYNNEQMANMFNAGAEWGKNQAKVEIQAQSMALVHGCPKEEPVNEELKNAANIALEGLLDKYGIVGIGSCLKMFKLGAEWQKEQDKSTIELAEDHAMLAGMEKMKEQMMKDATEVTVHIDAGDYPYIPQLELYDYDKDVPLAKEGDKYKVILIKEE